MATAFWVTFFRATQKKDIKDSNDLIIYTNNDEHANLYYSNTCVKKKTCWNDRGIIGLGTFISQYF